MSHRGGGHGGGHGGGQQQHGGGQHGGGQHGGGQHGGGNHGPGGGGRRDPSPPRRQERRDPSPPRGGGGHRGGGGGGGQRGGGHHGGGGSPGGGGGGFDMSNMMSSVSGMAGGAGGAAGASGLVSGLGSMASKFGGSSGAAPSRDIDVRATEPVKEGFGKREPGNPPPPVKNQKKKSLLIGINYVGSKNALQGCQQDVDNIHRFITSQGYPTDQRSQMILRDDEQTDPHGKLWPNGANILAAMQWLVSEPGTCNFLHYSGHGGQVADTDGNRVSGFDSTLVPFDYEKKGQIPSGVLHKILVSRLPPKSTLFMIFDCCHSGSVAELPYIYRADADGNVSMMDNLKAGMRLVGAANSLIQGGFSVDKVAEGRQLLAGAQTFFKGFSHQEDDDANEHGLDEQDFADQYEKEKKKNVWMYSGCEDDQTSADATIKGSHVGAMSYAFLETMKTHGPKQSYLQILQNTRQVLKGKYTQIPQLSVGYDQDLNYEIHI